MTRQEVLEVLEYLDGKGIEVNDMDRLQDELLEFPAEEIVIGVGS